MGRSPCNAAPPTVPELVTVPTAFTSTETLALPPTAALQLL